MQNRKGLALFFSIVPGAGHMYLGLMRKGVQLMGLFFLIFYLSQSFHTDLLLIFAPVIWFYSFFDARVKVHMQHAQDEDLAILSWVLRQKHLKEKARWGGILLIAFGTLVLMDQAIFPLLNLPVTWQIQQALHQSILPMVLIVLGIKLVSASSQSN